MLLAVSGRWWYSARSMATVLVVGIMLAGVTAIGAVSPAAAAAPVVTDEVNATADQPGPGAVSRSPSLAFDLTDSRVLALANEIGGADQGCALRISPDGGRTWKQVRPVSNLPTGATGCLDPEAFFDRSGLLYFLFTAGADQPLPPISAPPTRPVLGTYLAVSPDRGATFGAARQVLGPDASAARIEVDPTYGDRGRIHMAWIQRNSAVMTAHSDDGGATFSEPVTVGPSAPGAAVPAVTWGLAGAVHVAWFQLGDGTGDASGSAPWQLEVATSHDGGERFDAPTAVASGIVASADAPMSRTPPALAAARDLVCLAWTDARLGDSDVFARCSVDGGRKWVPRGRVPESAVAGGGAARKAAQFLPALSVTLEGLVQAGYYESTVDGARTDVFVTSTSDAGRSFQPPLRVTATGFGTEGRDLGGPLALQSRGARALVAWSDARVGDRQDIYVAVAAIPIDDTQTKTNPLLIPALILLAIIAFVVYRGWRRALADDPEGSMVGP